MLGGVREELLTVQHPSQNSGSQDKPLSREDGKFPISEHGRCSHVESWTRLRGKRGHSYFFCKLCGVGWRQPTKERKMKHMVRRLQATPRATWTPITTNVGVEPEFKVEVKPPPTRPAPIIVGDVHPVQMNYGGWWASTCQHIDSMPPIVSHQTLEASLLGNQPNTFWPHVG
jgi:hypothetical protein